MIWWGQVDKTTDANVSHGCDEKFSNYLKVESEIKTEWFCEWFLFFEPKQIKGCDNPPQGCDNQTSKRLKFWAFCFNNLFLLNYIEACPTHANKVLT